MHTRASIEKDPRGSSTRVRGNRQGSVYTGRISWPLCTVASGSPHFLWDFGDASRSRAANLDKTRERAKNREKMPHEETKAAAVEAKNAREFSVLLFFKLRFKACPAMSEYLQILQRYQSRLYNAAETFLRRLNKQNR